MVEEVSTPSGWGLISAAQIPLAVQGVLVHVSYDDAVAALETIPEERQSQVQIVQFTISPIIEEN